MNSNLKTGHIFEGIVQPRYRQKMAALDLTMTHRFSDEVSQRRRMLITNPVSSFDTEQHPKNTFLEETMQSFGLTGLLRLDLFLVLTFVAPVYSGQLVAVVVNVAVVRGLSKTLF